MTENNILSSLLCILESQSEHYLDLVIDDDIWPLSGDVAEAKWEVCSSLYALFSSMLKKQSNPEKPIKETKK